MERIIDRFDKYMETKGLNDNKVTVKLGLSVGVLSKSRGKDRDLSRNVIERILKSYPDLDETWLLTGNGQMISNLQQVDPASELLTKISQQEVVINELREEKIKYLDIIAKLTNTVSQLTTNTSGIKKKEAI